jgi:hypothetical protein
MCEQQLSLAKEKVVSLEALVRGLGKVDTSSQEALNRHVEGYAKQVRPVTEAFDFMLA